MIRQSVSFLTLFLFSTFIVIQPVIADDDDDEGRVDHRYVRVVDGDGIAVGFCEFERKKRKVRARAIVTGAVENGFVTAWKFVDGSLVGHLDGTVATAGGDANLAGRIKIRKRGADVKLVFRRHNWAIQDIADDDQLLSELTTASGVGGGTDLGSCETSFTSNRDD